MNLLAHQLSYSTPQLSLKHTCPECSDLVYRVPRRLIDRLISLFSPVQRYRCFSPYCTWEGNMPRNPENQAQAMGHMEAEHYRACEGKVVRA